MKKITLTIFILSQLVINSIGQGISLKLFVTDSVGKKDTIEFGLNNSATLDVDDSFGEQDLYGQAWDTLDIRIIQRDSIHHHCLMKTNWFSIPLAPPLYYENNRDFKTEYRPFGPFGTINMNFEVLIRALRPPVVVTTDFSGISGSMYEGWSALHLLGNDCQNVETKSIYFVNLDDTIYTLNDTLSTLVAEFQHEVGVNDFDNKQIIIYPNPTQNIIYIKSDYLYDTKLWNVFGKLIVESNENSIDLTSLQTGLYILEIYDKQDKLIKREKVIKK